MVTISIINLKGGVAKTLSAVNMAHILATVHSKRVLLVDNDKQGNASKMFGLHSYEEMSVAEVLTEKAPDMEGIIAPTRYENLDLIPANMNLLRANLAVMVDNTRQRETRFRKAFRAVSGSYDFCIIDNAPDINISTINALVASDDVIIPIKIDKFAFDGLAELKEQIENTQEDLNPALRLRGCLVTSYQRNDVNAQGEEWLRTQRDFPVFATHIRRTEKVDESTFAAAPIIEYSRRCGAAADYLQFVREYLQMLSDSDTTGKGGPHNMGKFNLVDLLNGAGEQVEQQEAARAEARPQKPPYKIVALSVFDLVPSEGNFYSIDEIEKLKRDIELAGGVKQNLTVTPLDGGKYKILAGHRRRRACLELVEEGKREYELIPCGIEPRQQDNEMQEIREELLIITTNSQREKTDWDRVQETKHLHDVLRRYKARGGKLPGRLREIIADTLNTSETQVGRMGAIAKNLIPDFQEEMREKRLGISAAYELSGMPEEQQRAALEEYREKGSFSVNDAKQRKETDAPPRRKVRTLDEALKEHQQESGNSDGGAGRQTPPPAISPQQEQPPAPISPPRPLDGPPAAGGEEQPAAPAPQDRPVPESSGRQDGEESEIASTINRLNDLCAYCMDKGEQCDGSRDWTLDVKALLSAIERLGGRNRMNGYAQGFNISGEEIAVFVSAARKAADIMNISISELFGKLESYARAMEAIGAFFDSILNAIRETADNSADIMEEIAALEISPPPSKLERLWRTQRRRAERERMRVFLKYLEFLFVIRRYKPP